MNICLFVSTTEFDPVSALIRVRTECDWSHCGFYDRDSKQTFSAMDDGKGVAWRPIGASQKLMLLDCEHIGEIFQEALKLQGKPYDELDIVGIALALDLHRDGHLICDVMLFDSAQKANRALLAMWAIPVWHLTPRDLLLSPLISKSGDQNYGT